MWSTCKKSALPHLCPLPLFEYWTIFIEKPTVKKKTYTIYNNIHILDNIPA